MERLPNGVVSEVLVCLSARDIASLVSCDRFLLSMVTSMGCLSTRQRYLKPVGDAMAYTQNLLLCPMAGTAGSVTFRPSVPLYRFFAVKKLMLQSLLVQGERDAAKWLAVSYAMNVPPQRASSLWLYRNVDWDFQVYTILCNAVERCYFPDLSLNIKSVPAIMDHDEVLPISSQAFLCCLLCAASKNRPRMTLNLCGTPHDSPHVPVPDGFVDAARRRVDDVFKQTVWYETIDVHPLHDFRSSTVALGRVLATANPRLRALRVSCYAFDEMESSRDVSSLSSYLQWGAHELVRVNLHRLQFGSGTDFCHLLKALCKVPSLQVVRLSGVECLVDPPEDPLAILFEEGPHIRDLRLRDVARVPANVPFHLLQPPGYRCMALNQMFLDTSNLQQLLTKLPSLKNLVCVNVSSNGIDGSVLGLFARVLKEPGCTMKRLNLASNIITGSAVPYFCQALAANQSLETLDMRDNFLGTQSSFKLLETVVGAQDSRMTYLNVDGNQVRYRMQDLCRILMASGKRSIFRQVSLRANPCVTSYDDDSEDVYEYKAFFKQQYNICFLF
jgi:hypothetical protein